MINGYRFYWALLAETGQDLSVEEEKRYLYHFAGNARIWENIHYQYRQGMFDELEFDAERAAWADLIGWNKRFVLVWCKLRNHYSIEFVAEIESLFHFPVQHWQSNKNEPSD